MICKKVSLNRQNWSPSGDQAKTLTWRVDGGGGGDDDNNDDVGVGDDDDLIMLLLMRLLLIVKMIGVMMRMIMVV